MKVTVTTQVYNGKQFIQQTIESILNQTHRDLEYIIVDSGSTDGSLDIIEEYAAKDSRIKIKRFAENKREIRWGPVVLEMGTGEYFAECGHDDWFEPTFLERLVEIAERTNADIVSTNSWAHIENSEDKPIPLRVVYDQPLELCNEDFAKYYTLYHCYFRTYIAKVIRTDLLRNMPHEILYDLTKTFGLYGTDTVYVFSWLRMAQKIYLDNSILHNYRVRSSSASRTYERQQSETDLYLYNDAIDFLSEWGPISLKNMRFIHQVYANAIVDTLDNLGKSQLTPTQKLGEYRKILERGETVAAIKGNSDAEKRCRERVFTDFFNCVSMIGNESEGFTAIVKRYFPNCASAVTFQNASLFAEDHTLMSYLANDYRKPMVKYIVSLVEKQKYTERYDLGDVLRLLSYDKPIANEISDVEFIQENGSIYLLIWNEKYTEAFEQMTDILFKSLVPNDTFYETYLSLAASLDCADEFVFGKIKQAHYYCDNGNRSRAAELLNDLTDMGVEHNEEMTEIRSKL